MGEAPALERRGTRAGLCPRVEPHARAAVELTASHENARSFDDARGSVLGRQRNGDHAPTVLRDVVEERRRLRDVATAATA
ncbi:MAG: hypothetical protein AAGA56_10420, partial [Myxococcota bacterium]